MPPLFACFPVCLTFVGIAILALLVFATGMVGPAPTAPAEEAESKTPQPRYDSTGPPAWWVIALIFFVVMVAFFSLHWIGADWQPGGP